MPSHRDDGHDMDQHQHQNQDKPHDHHQTPRPTRRRLFPTHHSGKTNPFIWLAAILCTIIATAL
ncbi:hypothetical protein E2542_SST06471 [Spatholobus suberectus]|nr:hypothetical protein E2542_SST06471 [Spatholobus suberectus]